MRKKSNFGWAERAGITKEVMLKLYEEQTDAEIASQHDVTEAAVAHLRNKYEISAVTTRQRRDKSERVGLASLDELTPALLTDLYAGMSGDDVGALYGVAAPAITRLRKLWGIPSISKSERATSVEPLTEEQKAIITGTLLGDAHLSEHGSLKIFHGHDQITYLRRLHALLRPHSKPIRYEEKVLSSGQVCFSFGFKTIQHVWLAALHQIFYPEGVKVFPIEVLKNLSATSLAYWYFDDGHLDGIPSFALGDISDEAAQLVASLVSARFGIEAYLSPKSGVSCKIMGIRGGHSSDTFFHLIRDYATPDMLYKIPPKYHPKGVVPAYPVRTVRDAIQFPKDLTELCRGWNSLGAQEKTDLLDQVFDFWRFSGFPYFSARPEEVVTLMNLSSDQIIKDGTIRANQVGQATCQSFVPHIWSARSQGSSRSPLEIFMDDASLKKALEFLLNNGDIPTAAAVRSAVRVWNHSGVYNFRPSAAKALVERCVPPGGLVWDPCAGYGGRLLGAVLGGARYVGCEPQTETYTGLLDLVRWLEGCVPGVSSRVQLFNIPAEDFIPPNGVDAVLTSPPYWKREVYGQEPSQSCIRYPLWEDWLDKFWKPVLRKAAGALRPGGWLLLNIDDFKLGGESYGFIQETRSICSELGLGEPDVLKYLMPSINNPDNHEVVLCWTKSHAVLSLVEPESLEPLKFKGGTPKPPISHTLTCRGCGIVFSAKKGDREFHDYECWRLHYKAERKKLHPPKTFRTFTCQKCHESWETEELGSFKYCAECREKEQIVQVTKVCNYRHCGQSFLDTSSKNTMKFCHPEHQRREKLFRSGVATSLDYFKNPDPVLNPNAKPKPVLHTCNRCRELFEVKDGEQNIRCPSCRDELRDKTCQKCGESYRDESEKNTRRYCDKCSATPVLPVSAQVSERTDNERRLRVTNGQGGRADDFKTMTPFTHSWWGRVGELLFLHLYPDASDSVAEFGNTVAFDAQHRTLGRVQVRTAKEEASTHGLPKWSFSTSGVSEHWDTGFFVAFSKDQTKVSFAWIVPADELPRQAKFMSPASSEYRHKVHEVSSENLDLLNRKFQAILASAKEVPQKPEMPPSDEIRVEYERVILGRIGEAIYHHLYPLADHVAGRNPLETCDFRDPDGTTVNVRVRRLASDGRWTFFRGKGCTAQVYFFIGMDATAHNVESFYRIPASDMPEFGFSIRPGSVSKWEQIKDVGLPKPVSDFVRVKDLEQIHLDICNLNAAIRDAMSEEDRDKLLKRAFAYHRVLGFPFTTIPSDKRLASEIEEIRRYQPVGKDLPIGNAGLGFCSAYMPHRFKSRNINSDFSAWEAFWDDEVFMKVLKSAVSWKNPILTRPGIRSALTALRRTPTQFRPAVMKTLVDTYCPEGGLVFDPCAGWGGRLTGALVSGRAYLGVEPIKETADALYRMGSRLCEHLGLDRGVFRIIEGMIQTTPTEGISADFAMTSPPYWIQEIYSGGGADEEQPLENWTADFLKPLFEKTRKALKPGACFAVNIADVKTSGGVAIPLESIAVKTASDCGFVLEGSWRMMKASFGNQEAGRYEPILIFRRLGVD